jgi:hypothetical protein
MGGHLPASARGQSPANYAAAMAYTSAEGRRQLLDAVAAATEQLAAALTALGEAYEQLDEHSGDTLEQLLFRPVQLALGRAKRAHGEFAARTGESARTFAAAPPGLPSAGAKGFVESAVEAVRAADAALAELQDSMLPVEVGDAQLRGELAELRELIAGVPQHARDLLRTVGR